MKISSTSLFTLSALLVTALTSAQSLSTSRPSSSSGNLMCTSPNHLLNDSFDGTYFKWETSEIKDGVSITGANFDPYRSGSNKLAFYWPSSVNGNAGVATTAATGRDWLVLQSGDQVGPVSVFSHATGSAANWTSGVDGYLGFKFDCSTAGVCYGYARIISTAPNGFPATLVGYCFDSEGDAITIDVIKTDAVFADGFESSELGDSA